MSFREGTKRRSLLLRSGKFQAMGLPLFITDAFTDVAFGGNPAAVCLLDRPRESAWMQAVATEMNLSETAFLLREHAGWRLRWFTPRVEVELCGHATLAGAHVLWEANQIGSEELAVFDTRSGRLTCARRGGWIEMDFPAEPPIGPIDPGALLAALGKPASLVDHQRNRMDYLVELADEAAVRALTPDMRMLARLPMRGVIVTAHSNDPRFDFVSRFFAPGVGIDEDPVTGSAHCCLAPYWAQKLGKREMVGYQASTRGGVVRVSLRNDRVALGGQAVTVARGQLTVD
jgi:predicted PhzF superfamily epimerase YddE/YHI9